MAAKQNEPITGYVGTVYVFQCGGDRERLREQGWPPGVEQAFGSSYENFRGDWLYFQVVGLTADKDGANLPQLDAVWSFQGILNEATKPGSLMINHDLARKDLLENGYHLYERPFSNSYYRRPSDHPDPDAPPFPAGAKIEPHKPLQISPAAQALVRDLHELLKN